MKEISQRFMKRCGPKLLQNNNKVT